MQTNLEKLRVLLRPREHTDYGANRLLADICGVDETLISGRWLKTGKVPVRYNHRIKAYVASRSDMSPVWRQAVIDCLEPDICPTCGQALEGRVI